MKRIVVIPSLQHQEQIDGILRSGRDKTRFLVRPKDTVFGYNGGSTVYAETPTERFIAADKWHTDDIPWDVARLCAFMDEYGSGFSYHSPAAFAHSLWKHIEPELANTFAYSDNYRGRLCHASLYGGRCEVLEFGTFHCHQYDINSSYPYAAMTTMYPYTASVHIVKPSIQNILRFDGISRITFSQQGWMPVLPVRINGRVYYLECDKAYSHKLHNETTYTHTELRYALGHGVRIDTIHRQYVSNNSPLQPFNRFMEYCFEQRIRTDDKIWKVIANSLIGRLCVASGPMALYRPAMSIEDMQQYPPERLAYYGVWFVGDDRTMPTNSNTLWASMTMAAARIRLYDTAMQGYTTYIDTDCVFVKHPRSCYEVGSDIGQMKHTEADYTIKGAKLYRKVSSDNVVTIKMKGVSKNLQSDSYDRARYTSERYMFDDGHTRPFVLEQGVLI